MCFFKVKHYFGHISGLIGPIDVKRKGSALVGYWAQYVTLTFDLTHDLDLGCFKVKFRNSSISGIVGLIDLKWKRKWVNMILGQLYDLALWPHPWPWPWSWNLKVRVWNGTADWHGTKRMWVIHSWLWYWLVWPWWGGRMYWIVTGVTSDVGVPSTYLVLRYFNWNPKVSILQNSFENIVCKTVAILLQPLCVNALLWFLHCQLPRDIIVLLGFGTGFNTNILCYQCRNSPRGEKWSTILFLHQGNFPAATVLWHKKSTS